ncbi:MAG: hypothetical protein ACQETQ_12590 [Spirochaetota bacterium]
MRPLISLLVLAALSGLALGGCATTQSDDTQDDQMAALPEYHGSSLGSRSVLRAAIPDDDSFHVRLRVRNVSDAPFTINPSDATFVHIRRWHSANALRGTHIQVFAAADAENTTRKPREPKQVLPQATRRQKFRLDYLTGGSYVTDLGTGQTTLTNGTLSLSTLRRLELAPSHSLALASGRVGTGTSGDAPGGRTTARRRSGFLVVRAGSDIHVITVELES